MPGARGPGERPGALTDPWRRHDNGKIRGMTCVGAYVDKATLLPETFWDMLRSRMRALGARIFATTNPDAPSQWLREKFIDDPEVRRSMKEFSFELDDNIHLTADYVEETKRMYSGQLYGRFILGAWNAAEGAVFDMFDRSRHVVDILPPITRWLALCVDYGTSNPTHAYIAGHGSGRMPLRGGGLAVRRAEGPAPDHRPGDVRAAPGVAGP
ncbi:terminase large subunit domain-containing protein [Streptomyces parvus]|uniref:terminase large subunit domain-containing protein n=1 Tax=Streptomyces parvus TaxID=66428 RepID=UPI003644D41F